MAQSHGPSVKNIAHAKMLDEAIARDRMIEDLGITRRSQITEDDVAYGRRGRFAEFRNVDTSQLEQSRAINQRGTQVALLAQQNSAALSAWSNLADTLQEVAAVKDLSSMMDGQTHRARLRAEIKASGGQSYSAEGGNDHVRGGPSTRGRGGIHRGRGGGTVGSRGRGIGNLNPSHEAIVPLNRPLDPAIDPDREYYLTRKGKGRKDGQQTGQASGGADNLPGAAQGGMRGVVPGRGVTVRGGGISIGSIRPNPRRAPAPTRTFELASPENFMSAAQQRVAAGKTPVPAAPASQGGQTAPASQVGVGVDPPKPRDVSSTRKADAPPDQSSIGEISTFKVPIVVAKPQAPGKSLMASKYAPSEAGPSGIPSKQDAPIKQVSGQHYQLSMTFDDLLTRPAQFLDVAKRALGATAATSPANPPSPTAPVSPGEVSPETSDNQAAQDAQEFLQLIGAEPHPAPHSKAGRLLVNAHNNPRPVRRQPPPVSELGLVTAPAEGPASADGTDGLPTPVSPHSIAFHADSVPDSTISCAGSTSHKGSKNANLGLLDTGNEGLPTSTLTPRQVSSIGKPDVPGNPSLPRQIAPPRIKIGGIWYRLEIEQNIVSPATVGVLASSGSKAGSGHKVSTQSEAVTTDDVSSQAADSHSGALFKSEKFEARSVSPKGPSTMLQLARMPPSPMVENAPIVEELRTVEKLPTVEKDTRHTRKCSSISELSHSIENLAIRSPPLAPIQDNPFAGRFKDPIYSQAAGTSDFGSTASKYATSVDVEDKQGQMQVMTENAASRHGADDIAGSEQTSRASLSQRSGNQPKQKALPRNPQSAFIRALMAANGSDTSTTRASNVDEWTGRHVAAEIDAGINMQDQPKQQEKNTKGGLYASRWKWSDVRNAH